MKTKTLFDCANMYKNQIIFINITISHNCNISTVVHTLQFPGNIFPPYISIGLLAISGDHIIGMLGHKQVNKA